MNVKELIEDLHGIEEKHGADTQVFLRTEWRENQDVMPFVQTVNYSQDFGNGIALIQGQYP